MSRESPTLPVLGATCLAVISQPPNVFGYLAASCAEVTFNCAFVCAIVTPRFSLATIVPVFSESGTHRSFGPAPKSNSGGITPTTV
jgi:hypothetical protein